MTQSLQSAAGRSVLRMERRLKHPPEKVWRAVTEPERLAEWFPTTVHPQLREGGVVEFGFGDAGTVTDLEEPCLFAFTWDEDHLRFELHPDGHGTLLVLLHTFGDRAGAASFAAGWHTCIAALGLALDGRAGVDPGIDPVALHERYVGEFGLDAGTTETTADGWRVRFERQLTRPADEVWAALTATAPAGAHADGHVLEHDGEPCGRVRWELVQGTGHGARLVLTHSGSAGEPHAALADDRSRIDELVTRLRRP
jgi:uncharacterized protein YndB with AHSA1/START domain